MSKVYFVGNPSAVLTALGGTVFGPHETREAAVLIAKRLAQGSVIPIYEAEQISTVSPPTEAGES